MSRRRIEDKSSSSPTVAASLLSSMMELSERNKHLLHWFVGVFSLMTILYRWSTNSLLSIILAVFTLYLINGGYRFCYIFLRTAYRDAISLIRFLRTRLFILKLKNRNSSVPKIFQQVAQANPQKILFHYGDDHWTMEQVDRFSNRVANYFIQEGFKKGDVVALFMDNRPEYVAIWLGLAKAGIIASLINHNQRSHSLIHSLRVVNCKALIFGSDLSAAVDKIHQDLESKNGAIRFYRFNTSYLQQRQNSDCCCSSKNLKDEMANMSPEPPQDRIDNVSFNDCLLYIYTSGTEGMPKAAIIKNSRFIYIGAVVKFMININKSDILYTCLPLYHLSAGTVGVCQSLIFGNTMVIRNKFSASNFWKDCVKYQCTIAQYIGEICRYLLSQPESPFDQTHSIRMMFGNGLRPNIWKDFVTRFNIKQIGELYGSTEGNANIINVDNKEGACGFISQILPSFYPATLIRIDEQTGQPVRNERGMCVKVQPGEAGELVAKIIHGDPSRAFDGYASKEATKKKIIHNVFRKGDCAFTTGDLLTMDQFGYLYFNDRCGDTFRWKGENISTMELEAIISNTLQLADCIVYGVEIPGCEGKAGMAAILDKHCTIDLNEMLQQLRSQLPTFMIPVFVRLVDHLEITATHKMPKVTYRNEGFNIKLIEDPIYFLDSKNFQYIPMNQNLYDELLKVTTTKARRKAGILEMTDYNTKIKALAKKVSRMSVLIIRDSVVNYNFISAFIDLIDFMDDILNTYHEPNLKMNIEKFEMIMRKVEEIIPVMSTVSKGQMDFKTSAINSMEKAKQLRSKITPVRSKYSYDTNHPVYEIYQNFKSKTISSAICCDHKIRSEKYFLRHMKQAHPETILDQYRRKKVDVASMLEIKIESL